MKTKLLYLALLSSITFYSQIQIGVDINGEAASNRSGSVVAISANGNIIASSAVRNNDNETDSGHVRIYEWDSVNWIQLGSDLDGEAASDYSGNSIGLSSDGGIVAIGASRNDGNGSSSGHVRVYQWNGSNWIQLGSDLDAEAAADFFGQSLSLSSDGSILAVGANRNDGNGSDSGHVRVYQWNGSNWIQIGNDINGEATGDQSGYSVSISNNGDIVAIGATYNNGTGSRSGHVRVYQWNSSSWVQLGNDINGVGVDDFSGRSVSLSANGDVVAIGATYNNGTEAGQVRVYYWNGTAWSQIGSDINGEFNGDSLGCSVSLSDDGNILAIGARFNFNTYNQGGHVRIYKYVSDNWTQVGIDIDGKQTSEFFGTSVSLSSDGFTVVAGAPYNDTNGNESGQTRIYDLSALLSIEDNEISKSFTVYPNPVNNHLQVQLNTALDYKKASIYNCFGQLVLHSNKLIINVSSLSSGVYFFVVETNKGKGVKKIIKN